MVEAKRPWQGTNALDAFLRAVQLQNDTKLLAQADAMCRELGLARPDGTAGTASIHSGMGVRDTRIALSGICPGLPGVYAIIAFVKRDTAPCLLYVGASGGAARDRNNVVRAANQDNYGLNMRLVKDQSNLPKWLATELEAMQTGALLGPWKVENKLKARKLLRHQLLPALVELLDLDRIEVRGWGGPKEFGPRFVPPQLAEAMLLREYIRTYADLPPLNHSISLNGRPAKDA